jgi:(p)ppGpp synthase/HD superfamily hydrolase
MDSVLIQYARNLAHDAHDLIGQKRKYTGEPYWVHTDAVANIVAEVGGSETMVAASHLHDIKEDVWTFNTVGNMTLAHGIQDLIARFELLPLKVKQYVDDLTDVYTREAYPSMNRKARKQAECERIGKLSSEAKTIKLADLIHNTESIVTHDPDFARVYIVEKLALLPYLSEGNPALLNRAAMQAMVAAQTLGIELPMIVFGSK